MKKNPRYATQSRGLHPCSLSLKIVLQGLNFSGPAVGSQPLSRPKAINGIGILSPLGSIPASSKHRLGCVPDQDCRRNQQDEPLVTAEQRDQAKQEDRESNRLNSSH